MNPLDDYNFSPILFVAVTGLITILLFVAIFTAQECTAYKFPDGATTDSGKVGWVNDGITYVRDVEEFCIQTDYKFR